MQMALSRELPPSPRFPQACTQTRHGYRLMPEPPPSREPQGGASDALAQGDPARDADRSERGTLPDDEPVYVISIAAKLAGLPVWTLRVLDKEAIVRPQRTAGDRRLYSDRDIARLARVRFLTEERGVNMNGVRLILEMDDGAHAPGAQAGEPIRDTDN